VRSAGQKLIGGFAEQEGGVILASTDLSATFIPISRPEHWDENFIKT